MKKSNQPNKNMRTPNKPKIEIVPESLNITLGPGVSVPAIVYKNEAERIQHDINRFRDGDSIHRHAIYRDYNANMAESVIQQFRDASLAYKWRMKAEIKGAELHVHLDRIHQAQVTTTRTGGTHISMPD